MKNLAVLLRKEGKEGTKLYNDIKGHDLPRGRVNLNKLEVKALSKTQTRQLRSMRFKGPGVQDAVTTALSAETTAKKSGETHSRGTAERY